MTSDPVALMNYNAPAPPLAFLLRSHAMHTGVGTRGWKNLWVRVGGVKLLDSRVKLFDRCNDLELIGLGQTIIKRQPQ